MTVKEALRGAMDADKLSAADVASKAGVNPQTVYRVLSGHHPSRLTITALRQIPGFSERYDNAAVA